MLVKLTLTYTSVVYGSKTLTPVNLYLTLSIKPFKMNLFNLSKGTIILGFLT
ncbi:hypothetical protein ONA02_00520 [Mycoplasmopsis felis]|uniref:hypothetical protein n=1 Tax=Mycoplasmopsis felis TaxID=33923 RepID=UPI0021AE7A56|nr:hypothetical protein [Mycoplasmopsis felis]MCU9931994.1 hypothetical protein [Mycoplasmopsis felis]MCU9937038.1 hypothetical protein [Mycoplasmopsis felis]UWV78423.1 hypothetical protein NWE59_06130 [Mycoplasmopsis felis]WAM02369.1 hypothetical protein ONA02_00520 [Mycoplasmopsis felis]